MTTNYVGRDIVGRLIDRFHLRTDKNTGMVLNPSVQPVTNVDSFPEHRIILGASIPVGSIGDYVMITVPKGKRWRVNSFYIWAVDGTYTISAFNICDKDPAALLQVKTFTSTTGKYYYPADGEFQLGEEWSILVKVDAYTNPGHVQSRVNVYEEDVK